ncbi:hypothetical protein IVA97_32175 [Bradyrhizobium sp. 15]|jgi:hypothetical protein|nr:hypothetical protein [Bradyrhizobium sp. 15]
MPAILTAADEYDVWMRAPRADAKLLQRPLLDGALKIVASGEIEAPALAALGFLLRATELGDKPQLP